MPVAETIEAMKAVRRQRSQAVGATTRPHWCGSSRPQSAADRPSVDMASRCAAACRAAARARFLNRRAWRVAVGAENTAIARLRLQQGFASSTFVEILAEIHQASFRMLPCPQTGQVSVETAFKANIGVSALRRGRIPRVRRGANERGDRRLGVVISDRRGLVLERDQHLDDTGNHQQGSPSQCADRPRRSCFRPRASPSFRRRRTLY